MLAPAARCSTIASRSPRRTGRPPLPPRGRRPRPGRRRGGELDGVGHPGPDPLRAAGGGLDQPGARPTRARGTPARPGWSPAVAGSGGRRQGSAGGRGSGSGESWATQGSRGGAEPPRPGRRRPARAPTPGGPAGGSGRRRRRARRRRRVPTPRRRPARVGWGGIAHRPEPDHLIPVHAAGGAQREGVCGASGNGCSRARSTSGDDAGLRAVSRCRRVLTCSQNAVQAAANSANEPSRRAGSPRWGPDRPSRPAHRGLRPTLGLRLSR